MKGLLVVAHGSRRQESNNEVRNLTSRIAELSTAYFDLVQCGFLEIAEPSISNGIHQCIRKGATEIVVLPYFLSAGRHVVEDIPNEINAARQLNPGVCIQIAPYLGAMGEMADLIVKRARQTIETL